MGWSRDFRRQPASSIPRTRNSPTWQMVTTPRLLRPDQCRSARSPVQGPRRHPQRHRHVRRPQLFARRTHHQETHRSIQLSPPHRRSYRWDRHHRIHRCRREVTLFLFFDHETIQPSLSSYLRPRRNQCPWGDPQRPPSTSIQAAINASSSGDVIILYPDTYAEDLVINGKALTMRPTSGTAQINSITIQNAPTSSATSVCHRPQRLLILEGLNARHPHR